MMVDHKLKGFIANLVLRLSTRLSPWVFTGLKIGLSSLAIGIVVSTVDLSSAWQRTAHQNLWLVLLAGLIVGVQIMLGALRWHVILRRLGATATISNSFQIFYVSVFFNTCLWGAVGGDMVRAWLSQRNQIHLQTALNSVVLDRVASLAAIGLLALVTAPWFAARADNLTTALIPSAISLAGITAIVVATQLKHLPALWHHYRIVRLLHSLGAAMHEIFMRPSAAAPVLAVAVTAQVVMALCAYVMAVSLSIDVGLLDCIVLMQPVALITALPISIGGWGVREAAIVSLFGLIGVPSGAALALSIQIGVLAVIMSMPGGFIWLMLRDKFGRDDLRVDDKALRVGE